MWLLVLLLPALYNAQELNVTVETSRGRVLGFHVDQGSNKSELIYGKGDVFLGIPYAQPPIGELRFKLPRPICNYTGVVGMKHFPVRCPQRKDPNQPAAPIPPAEDCLFLNVFTPTVAPKESFPVMVYVVGGTYTTGGTDGFGYEGIIRNLVSRDVIVVTIQYRLSVLGFFTTFTETFPPNRGLYDIVTALQWVQEEIDKFGGDPKRVTIFGQSAGGSAVSTLTLSPLARGLFQKAIQQSGAILQELETAEEPKGNIHKKRAKQICNITDDVWDNSKDLDQTLLNCFSNATLDDLTKNDFDEINWNPSIDGAFIPDQPEVLAKSRPKIATLIGDVHDEASYFMGGFTSHDLSSSSPSSVKDAIGYYCNYFNQSLIDTLADATINASGFLPINDSDHFRWAHVENWAETGLMFSHYIRKDAQWHIDNGNGNNLFLYTYNFPSGVCEMREADGWRPVPHAAELCFIFFNANTWQQADKNGTLRKEDRDMAEFMGSAWTNFAKAANFSSTDNNWKPATSNALYREIDGKTNPSQEQWRKDYNQLFNIDFPKMIGGAWPNLLTSAPATQKVAATGKKVLEQWQTAQKVCGRILPTTPVTTIETTTNSSPLLPPMTIVLSIVLAILARN